MTTWLIQSNLINRHQIDEITSQLQTDKVPYVEATLVPFIADMTVLGDLPSDNRVIPYGSTSMVIACMRDHKFKGLFFDPERFRTSRWMKERTDMLNQDALVMPLTHVPTWLQANPGEWFVKPDDDLKAFAGEVLTSDAISHWFDKMLRYDCVPLDQMCVVAKPIAIESEYRSFIVGGKVISTSLYKKQGRLVKVNADGGVVDYIARGMALGWLPMANVVMDHALTEAGEWKVIEFNCINASGFYDHNIGAIIKALTAVL